MAFLSPIILALLLLLVSAHNPDDICPNCNKSLPISFSIPTRVRPVATFTHSTPHSSFFGTVAVTPAPAVAFDSYVHPRILVDRNGWDAILNIYADDAHFDRLGSWSRYHRYFTLGKGPHSSHISQLAQLVTGGIADIYTGNIDYTTITVTQKTELVPLVEKISTASELNSQAFFMCALWTQVNELRMSRGHPSFLNVDTRICLDATVAWAKVLLAHRAYHCAGLCPGAVAGNRAYLWDHTRRFEVSNEWNSGGFNIALVYDVLYDRFTNEEQKIIRSAIAMYVLKKESWGNTVTSDRNSPNAALHPHRIFSNWAMYHSNLFLANLAIESETGFDAYVTNVLQMENETGFNQGLNTRFTIMIDAYMKHCFYPDGTTYEDGYSYFIALREGSLGLIAAHRRGLNVLDTNRFRNAIHNVAQMLEPWHCGNIIGHSSGGGESYHAWAGLLRYAYPDGILSNMVWRQRIGDFVKNRNPCRIEWYQTMTQLSFTGGEHGSVTNADSPGTLDTASQGHFKQSFYGTRRGLLIARSGLSKDHCYIHFDARPDAFFPGHDNADRGVFTFSAYQQTWIDDYAWRENVDSRKHSLMHVDGLAQDEKAPSVIMFKTEDDGDVVLAAANLTYAYNVQWARNWPDASPPRRDVNTYLQDGTLTKVATLFTEKEIGNPRDFGWPIGDDGADLGFTRPESRMNGDPDMGFRGMHTWKRNYRQELLDYAIRSVALVRVAGESGYFILSDSFRSSENTIHTYESYLMLNDDVSVDDSSSGCGDFTCKIVLRAGGAAQTDIHVTANAILSYSWEQFTTEKTHTRVIIKGIGPDAVDMFLGFHPHVGQPDRFSISDTPTGAFKLTYGSDVRYFELHPTQRDLIISQAPPTPAPPTPSATSSPIPSKTSIATATATATAMATATATATTTTTATATGTATATATANASPSGSTQAPPMAPFSLEYKRGLKYKLNDFDESKETFLRATTFQFQKVFTFVSITPARGRGGDRLSTCFKFTKGDTELAVYECANYNTRDCTLIGTSTRNCAAKYSTEMDKSDFRSRLENGKRYYVALSMNPNASGIGKVRILHARRRV